MPERTGKASRTQSTVESNYYRVFYIFLGERAFQQGFIGDTNWNAWVNHPETKSFSFKSGPSGILLTLRRESRAKRQFWYAFKKQDKKLYKVYVGKSEELTQETLNQCVEAMQAKLGISPHKLPKSKETTTRPEIFMADYQPAKTRKQLPLHFELTEGRREVLAMTAAGLQASPEHKAGIEQRKIARQLVEAGLLAEMSGDVNHRKHWWKLTKAGLKMIRSDPELQQRVKLHKM